MVECSICYKDAASRGAPAFPAGPGAAGTATRPAPATEHPQTTPADRGANPRSDWHVAVRATVRGRPDYRARFPVLVEAGGARSR